MKNAINTYKNIRFDLSKVYDDEYKDYLFDLIEAISEEYLKPIFLDDIVYSRISEWNFNELMIGHEGIIASEQRIYHLMWWGEIE